MVLNLIFRKYINFQLITNLQIRETVIIPVQRVQKGRGRGGNRRIRDNSSGWRHARPRTKMAMSTAAVCRYRTDPRVLSQFKPIRPIFRRAHRLISLNYYVNKRPCLTRR